MSILIIGELRVAPNSTIPGWNITVLETKYYGT